MRRPVLLLLGALGAALVFASLALAGAVTFGSQRIYLKGTYTGVVTYTFLGSPGVSTTRLAGMTDPIVGMSWDSVQGGEFTVTQSGNCLKATMVAGSNGNGGASVTARRANGLPGQNIRVGGKPMGVGDYLQACAQ